LIEASAKAIAGPQQEIRTAAAGADVGQTIGALRELLAVSETFAREYWDLVGYWPPEAR
jgi:hypothetical protein